MRRCTASVTTVPRTQPSLHLMRIQSPHLALLLCRSAGKECRLGFLDNNTSTCQRYHRHEAGSHQMLCMLNGVPVRNVCQIVLDNFEAKVARLNTPSSLQQNNIKSAHLID